jgi:predicted nucleic acid-binding protein
MKAMEFVLDNSVVARWLLQDGSAKDRQYASMVLDLLEDNAKALVPPIFNIEIANVIARAEHLGQLHEAVSAQFIETLESMSIEVDDVSQSKSLTSVLDLARRYKLSSYDASYLEIALRKGIGIASLDKELMSAFKSAGGKSVQA